MSHVCLHQRGHGTFRATHPGPASILPHTCILWQSKKKKERKKKLEWQEQENLVIGFIGSKWFPLWKALCKRENTVQSAFVFSVAEVGFRRRKKGGEGQRDATHLITEIRFIVFFFKNLRRASTSGHFCTQIFAKVKIH